MIFNSSGQRNDSETSLFQNWHRDYDASLGRYVQSDPIGLAGGINTYGYVGGNPLTFIDENGLSFASALPGRFVIDFDNVGKGLRGGRLGVVGGLFGGALLTGEILGGYAANNIIEQLDRAHGNLLFNPDQTCPPGGWDPCEGLRRQIKEHQDKLRQYLRHPLSSDNKGFLANALANFNRGRFYSAYHGRVRNLNDQIENFKRQLEDCERRHGL